MSQCHCKTLPGGDKVICDTCASHMIEMLSDVIPEQAGNLLPVLTSNEYVGMMSAVDIWMKGLQSGQEVHTW